MFDLEVTTIDGDVVTLEQYRHRTLLIVNVASRCGYTPQYAGLEAMYRRHKDEGFVVLGFPSNQFGRQEPGTESEIRQFCTARYGVTFPLFAKIDVNGPNAHPLFRFLTSQKKGLFGRKRLPWNFSKFLVSREGEVVRRYSARDTPETIEKDVVRLLAQGA